MPGSNGFWTKVGTIALGTVIAGAALSGWRLTNEIAGMRSQLDSIEKINKIQARQIERNESRIQYLERQRDTSSSVNHPAFAEGDDESRLP